MYKNITRAFFAMLLIALAFIAGSIVTSKSEKITINDEAVVPFNDGWDCTVNGVPQSEELRLPGNVNARRYDRVVLSNTLPDTYPEGMTVCVRSVQQFVRVFVDDALVYSYGYASTRSFGKSPGSAWNFIRLPKDTRGKKLSIELISPYDGYAGSVNAVAYGSKNANVFKIMQTNMMGLFISIVIFIVGLVLLTGYYYMRRLSESDALLYLGLFAILAGLWSSSETRMLQFVFNNQSLVTNCGFIFLMLMCVPLLLFIAKTHTIHNKVPFYVLCYALLGNFAVVVLLQVFNLYDFIELNFSIAILLLASICLTVYTIVTEIFVRANREIVVLGMGSCVLAVFSLLDFAHVFEFTSGDNAFFFRIGVLLYILVLTYYIVRRMVDITAAALEAKMLAQLAFVDLLTDLQNRTAFETYMDPFRKNVENCRGLTICIFDINNLKLANDTFGHQQGDSLIVTTARTLKATFGNAEPIFRIGGDEFCVFIHNSTACAIDKQMEQFLSLVRAANETAEVHLSVALGYATFDAMEDETVDNLYMRADARMYENKVSIKGARRKTDIVF